MLKKSDKVKHTQNTSLGYGEVVRVNKDKTVDVIFNGRLSMSVSPQLLSVANDSWEEDVGKPRREKEAQRKAKHKDEAIKRRLESQKNYEIKRLLEVELEKQRKVNEAKQSLVSQVKHAIGRECFTEASALFDQLERKYPGAYPQYNEEYTKAKKASEQKALEAKARADLLNRIQYIKEQTINFLEADFLTAEQKYIELDTNEVCSFSDIKFSWVKINRPELSKLNDEQIKAIIDTSQTCLLRARAGSGKTTVIKHKIDFLRMHSSLPVNSLMVLAFNKAAKTSVNQSLQKDFKIFDYNNAKTFHGIAHSLVKPKQQLLYDEKQKHFIDKILSDELNPALKEAMYQFFKQEYQELENIGALLSKEDYYSYRRNQTFDTLKGDPVKSKGEKWLADFFFEHSINYVYEKPWFRDANGEKGNYYPDFSLFINGRYTDIVWEHWGIDEFDSRQTVPEEWSQTWQQYKQNIGLKRDFWKTFNKKEKNRQRQVKFLETSIKDMKGGREAFERIVHQKLTALGIQLQRIPEQDLYDLVVKKKTSAFAGMCLQFIQKAKKACLSPAQLQIKVDQQPNTHSKQATFNNIACFIYQRYQDELQRQNKIDFDDLMAMAATRIHENAGDLTIALNSDSHIHLNELNWLLMDEYQDFSQLFYNVIDAMQKYNPALRVFAVGDNWQAINGFAGSNLDYFDNFCKYFPEAKLLDLSNNYRSQKTIVDNGNLFMKHRDGKPSIAKNTTHKTLPIKKFLTNKVFIDQRGELNLSSDNIFMTFIDSDGEQKNVDTNFQVARFLKLCHQLIAYYPDATSFMVLNRTNQLSFHYSSLNMFITKLKSTFIERSAQWYKAFDQRVSAYTSHGAKGAEADVVIMLNVVEGKYPLIHPDNQLYALVGDDASAILAEEERLFYVAITRAKRELYIITETGRQSEYLKQIQTEKFEFPRQ